MAIVDEQQRIKSAAVSFFILLSPARLFAATASILVDEHGCKGICDYVDLPIRIVPTDLVDHLLDGLGGRYIQDRAAFCPGGVLARKKALNPREHQSFDDNLSILLRRLPCVEPNVASGYAYAGHGLLRLS